MHARMGKLRNINTQTQRKGANMRNATWIVGCLLGFITAIVPASTIAGQTMPLVSQSDLKQASDLLTSPQQQVIPLTSGQPATTSCPGSSQAGKYRLCETQFYIYVSDKATEITILVEVQGKTIFLLRFGAPVEPPEGFDCGGELDKAGRWRIVIKRGEECWQANTRYYFALANGESFTQRYTITVTITEEQPNKDPVARFTYSPSEPKVGESVRFDGTDSYDPDGSIERYRWDFGDGSTDSGSVVYHSFSRAGSYRVTLTVTDNKGATNSTSKTVTVKESENKPPIARFTYSPSKPKAGESVRFDGTGSYDPDGTIERYQWDFGDGSTDSGSVVYHSFSRAGSYRVTLTVTDNRGGKGSTSDTIIVITPPTADFTADPTRGPAPLTVQFTDRSSGDITSYSWDFGDGGTSTDKNPRYTYNTPGKFTVKLTVKGPGGEDTKIRSNYIEVTSSRPTADFTANPTRGAAPLTVQFTDKSTGDITSWSWDFGDGGTSTEKNPRYTYNTPGKFTVKLTVRGPGGEDTKTRSNYITVIGPPKAPSDLMATPRGQTQIDLSWRDNSDNEDGFEIFRKIQGQSYRPIKKLGANTKSYSDANLSPGTTYCYQVRAYNAAGSSDPSNEACATTDRAVTAPVADFEANPTRGPVPLTVQFTDKSRGDITNWSWDFGDGGTSSEKNPSHTYRTVGTFTVKLTVRGPGGESSKTGTIEVTPEEIRSFEFEATAEQDKPATIPLPDNIKSQLPEGVTRFVEVPNTTRRGRTSSSLKDAGLDLNPDTGTIFGTPTKPGRFYFLIEARSDTAALAEIWAIITITGAGQPPPPPPTGGTLISGVPQKGTVGPGPKTLSDQFTITVLEGTWTLLVKLQNQGSGDINLHVRLGKPVEIVAGEIVADFSSTSPTGNESLTLAGPVPPGIYYIAVENMESTPQNFTILAAVVPVLQMINSGEPVSGRVEPAPLGGHVLALTQYVIEVPEEAKNLSAILENLSVGAMKLHIRYGKPVELSDGRVIADFSSDAPLGVESITIAGAQLRADKYYIAIENLEPYAQEFKLTVTLTR